MSILELLPKVPLFSQLDQNDLQTLSASARERDYQSGEVLMHQGDSGVGLFILSRGKVSITQVRNSEVFDLGTLESGQVFGELSLLDDMPRTATVTAIEPCSVIIVPIWDFRAALRENPSMALSLLATLSKRIRNIENQQSR